MIDVLMNPDVITGVFVLLLFVLLVIYLISKNQIKILRHTAYMLVTEVENNKEFGRGTGDRKYAKVADEIYMRIPTILKLFITPKVIGELIDAAVQLMKEKMYTTE